MATMGSLLFSRELGINKSSVFSSQPKGMRSRRDTQCFPAGLSSHASLQEVWSVHLLTIQKPIKQTPTRCNILVCQSLFSPDGGNQIPVLKTAATVLTRSYEAFHGRSLVVQLIPAVRLIAFAAWGLGPLMRVCRVLFLQKNDNTWNKSKEHFVMTSYIQPLLLWGGTVLICRVLEPVILPSASSQAVKHRLLNFVCSLSTVLAFAYCLSRRVMTLLEKLFILQCGLHLFRYSWSCWGSLLRNGSQLVVLVLYCSHLQAARYLQISFQV